MPSHVTLSPGFAGSHPRARRSTRVSAALVALAFAAASLLGMVHEATTSHVRCAAHGELIDSSGFAGPGARSAAMAPGLAGHAVASALSSGSSHGDEHCLLASALRQSRMTPDTPAVTAAWSTLHDVVRAPPPCAAARSAGLYRIAPKTSPPSTLVPA